MVEFIPNHSFQVILDRSEERSVSRDPSQLLVIILMIDSFPT